MTKEDKVVRVYEYIGQDYYNLAGNLPPSESEQMKTLFSKP